MQPADDRLETCAATPGEVIRAEELGAEIVKVFPARTLGPSFVADVLAPCPWSRLMPTGGIAPHARR